MAKHLLQWSKRSHWNIERGDSEYFHRFARKHPIRCRMFGWSKCQWRGYSANLQVSKEANKGHEVGGYCDIGNSCIETSVSKALNNDKTDEREFGILQELHLRVANELANVNRKMKSETRTQLQKNLLKEIIEIKKTLRTRDAS